MIKLKIEKVLLLNIILDKINLEIIDFLSEWISKHIMIADRGYAVFLKTVV